MLHLGEIGLAQGAQHEKAALGDLVTRGAVAISVHAAPTS